jgi:hypothetical protein
VPFSSLELLQLLKISVVGSIRMICFNRELSCTPLLISRILGKIANLFKSTTWFQIQDFKLLYVNIYLNSAVIDLGDYNIANGIDFSVHGGQKGRNELVITLLINNQQKWRNIKVSYLVSSRPDIILGSFIADTF